MRGPDVISPLEGDDDEQREDQVTLEDGRIHFDIRVHANPNNTTSTKQSIAARAKLTPEIRIIGNLVGIEVDIPASRLMRGALSGNIGGIDTPAFRLPPLPNPKTGSGTVV